METQSLKRRFIKYLIPSVVSQWVFALYAMVDGIFVARGVGETALAAINISIPFVTFLFAVSLIFAVGTSTIVSIYFGQKKEGAANRVYTQNLLVVIGFGILLTALVLFNLDGLVAFLGASGATFDFVKDYIGTIACFSVFFILSYYFEILIKADGRPKMATAFIIVGVIANCILDYVFVFVIPWGTFGAAIATGISNMIVAGLFIAYFLSKYAKLKLAKFTFDPRLIGRTIKLGLPSGITEFSGGLMVFCLNQAIIHSLGSEAIVSYTIVSYVNTILAAALVGVVQGFQPLVSYEYGRGRTDYAEKLLKYGIISGVVITAIIVIPALIGTEAIVNIFVSTDMPELRAYSVEVFRIFSVSFLLVGLNLIIQGYFVAVEEGRSAIIISIARGFVLIPLALVALIAITGGQGIWWAPTVSEGITLGITAILFAGYMRKAKTEKEEIGGLPAADQKLS